MQLERVKFNVHDYELMIKAGVFIGNGHVELIEGEILQMPPLGSYHIGTTNTLAEIFIPPLIGKAVVSIQSSIILDDMSEPEPDLLVLRFRKDRYKTSKPKPEDVLLLIEVSDSTLRYDRDVKVPLYARNGIPEVWLVNLPKKIVEVYCNPHKGKYRSVKKLGLSETVSPQLIPKLKLKVAEIIG
jgi:Uma2 family endonuclease